MTALKLTKLALKSVKEAYDERSPSKGLEWNCSAHALRTQNKTKEAPDRAKAGLETHQIEPKK